ncbi:MAG: AbrB/MazE/SpoVT family DNA-binding domain-containing protein [Christensenellaceae bacterium]|jgi:transcriptional pleiotropic regulator of transition state genes
MKSTGIVRPVDSLGRIVLPIELRRIMGIECKDSIEIFVDDQYIMLKKYQPSCIFCNSMDDIIHYKNKLVCKECVDKMAAEYEE